MFMAKRIKSITSKYVLFCFLMENFIFTVCAEFTEFVLQFLVWG